MQEEYFTQFEFFLDSEQYNKVFVKYLFSDDLREVREFVIVYFTKRFDEFVEVVKYDYSKKERLHVHYFWRTKHQKEYLDLDVRIDVVIELKDGIVKNWRKYLLKFEESKTFI